MRATTVFYCNGYKKTAVNQPVNCRYMQNCELFLDVIYESQVIAKAFAKMLLDIHIFNASITW